MIDIVYKNPDTQEEKEYILLPKNVRQIGEADAKRRIYIEDYVDTYIKEKIRENKNTGCIILLIGKKEIKTDIFYFFSDGAIMLPAEFISREYRIEDHGWEYIYNIIKKYFVYEEIIGWMIYDDDLSIEEIRKAQRKNFNADTFLLITKESYAEDENYHIYYNGGYEQISGTFVYYEKNEAMQNYMIDYKSEQTVEEKNMPEAVFRKTIRNKKKVNQAGYITGIMKMAGSVLLLGIIIMGIYMLNNFDDSINAEEIALQTDQTEEQPEERIEVHSEENVQEQQEQQEIVEVIAPANEPVQEMPKEYVVMEGETLLSICRKIYGSTDQLDVICELNGIENGDLIKAGEKLLLP